MRARAFHIMDPKGVLEMLLIFLEARENEAPHVYNSSSFEVGVTVPYLVSCQFCSSSSLQFRLADCEVVSGDCKLT